MADYEYAGPGPHEDPELGLVRPGDRHEWDSEPPWGPWRLIEAPESDSAPSGTQPPAPAPESPAPSGPAAPATASEEM